MLKSKLLLVVVASMAMGLGGGGASAAEPGVFGLVTGVLINGEGTYGGCLVRVEQSPNSVLPACAPQWLSFDCTGERGMDVVSAYRMVDLAQMAQALGLPASIKFSDEYNYEGYCVAYQINVIRN